MTYNNAPRPPRPLPGEGSAGGGFRYASFQHRLGAYALDAVLAFFTLGIGWLIWSLIVWGEGQTPAKKILKIRVRNAETGAVATWGHMAVREFLVPVTQPKPAAPRQRPSRRCPLRHADIEARRPRRGPTSMSTPPISS